MLFLRNLLLLALCSPLLATAQKPRLLRFDRPVQSLDTVREVDGVVKLRYEFTNISPKPVTLLDIHTQCGCLRPAWERRPVPPGGQGVVEAEFDPKNRLHAFSIGLTVISTDGDYKKFNTLKAEGYVISRIPEEEIFYPYELSARFRADVEAVGMRLFRPGDGPRMRQIKLYNRTDRTLRAEYDSGSPSLRMSGPSEIAPHAEAVVEYELDPRKLPVGKFTIRTVLRAEGVPTVIEVSGAKTDKPLAR